MRRPLLILLVLVGACREKVTHTECSQMLGRYVEMTAAQDPSLAALSPEQASELKTERIAEKRASLEFARAEEQCLREVSREQLACAMKAKTPNDWEACVE